MSLHRTYQTGVDLKNKTVILSAKMGLFRNSRGVAIWDKQAIAKAIDKSIEQRRGTLL